MHTARNRDAAAREPSSANHPGCGIGCGATMRRSRTSSDMSGSELHVGNKRENDSATRQAAQGDLMRQFTTHTKAPRVSARDAASAQSSAVRPVGPGGLLQSRLQMGSRHDNFELEADAMADLLVGPSAVKFPASNSQEAHSSKSPGSRIARWEDNDARPQRVAAKEEFSAGEAFASASRPFFEPRFGHDFSRVRFHDGPQGAAVSRAVGADAFTVDEGRAAGEAAGGGKLAPIRSEGAVMPELAASIFETRHGGEGLASASRR